MTVFKYFLKITMNNKFAILLYVLLFFFTAVVNISSVSETSFTETRLNVGIIDNENSELSKGLIKYIESRNDIVVTREDESYIEEQIFMGTADAVLIISSGFDSNAIDKREAALLYTDDRKPESIQIENQINKYLSFAGISHEDGKYNLDDVEDALKETVEVNFADKQGEARSNINEWVSYYFNLTGYAILAIYIMAIGIVMSELNNEKLVTRRNVSSKTLLKYNIEVLLGQLTIAGLTTLIFIIGFIVWKGNFIELIQFEKYIVNIMVFSISILSLTFLITNITKNRYATMALATVLSLGTSFISGVMVPQEILSENVLNIAKFFPVYYFVKANNTNINTLWDIRYELLMMMLFAVVFLLLGIIVSKRSQSGGVKRVTRG